MAKRQKGGSNRRVSTSWDPLSTWYDGWVGEGGSEHHREVAIPAVMDLLDPKARDSILDIGAGQGVLAPYVAEAGGRYTGIDASARLIEIARKRHGQLGRFVVGDARAIESILEIQPESFSAVVFLLSLQDMDPLDAVLRGAAWALEPEGRMVALLTHPCFRIPRQSGWGWDNNRKLRYRRIDRYITPLPVPMKPFPDGSGVTRSFHRPLSEYINQISAQGLCISRMLEIPTYKRKKGRRAKAINRSNEEIPLFLGFSAIKMYDK